MSRPPARPDAGTAEDPHGTSARKAPARPLRHEAQEDVMSAAQPVATRPARAGGAPAGDRHHLGLALFVIATAQLMVVLDATIVNVALPHIQRALGFSGTGLE